MISGFAEEWCQGSAMVGVSDREGWVVGVVLSVMVPSWVRKIERPEFLGCISNSVMEKGPDHNFDNLPGDLGVYRVRGLRISES